MTGACFAEGMKQCGLAAALGTMIAGRPDLMIPLAAVVPVLFAFVSGSGIASTKGLYEFFYDPAVDLGHDPNAVGAVVSPPVGAATFTANVPSAISECVAFRMYQATAAEFIPLPTMEIRLAAKTKRARSQGRCCTWTAVRTTENGRRVRCARRRR